MEVEEGEFRGESLRAKKNKFSHPNIAAKLLTDALCTPKVGLMATGESFCNKV